MDESPSDLVFEELLRRLTAGERDAWTEFVTTHRPILIRIIRRRIHTLPICDLIDPDDIFQSGLVAFLNLCREERLEVASEQELLWVLNAILNKKILKRVEYHRAAKRDCGRTRVYDAGALELLTGVDVESEHLDATVMLDQIARLLDRKERALLDEFRNGASWSDMAEPRGQSPQALRATLIRACRRAWRVRRRCFPPE